MKEHEIKRSGSIFADRYVILNLLGSGGMGAVYLAKDRFIDDSLVAIKILHRQYSTSFEFVQRFLREVKATRLVSHPNVVRSFDAAEFQGDYFYTMEFLKGTRLSELNDEEREHHRLPWSGAENIMRQICFGLEAIHKANLVHRDLKPDNIFLEDDDIIKITDFGVVRTNNSSLTQSHSILGTLDYVPPEVWNGRAPTAQSDIYALGLVLYELLSGQIPFHAETPAELMKLHLTLIPPPISEYRSDIPPWANDLIMSMLAKDLDERPESVTALLKVMNTGRKIQADAAGSSSSNDIVPSSSRRTKRSDEISDSLAKFSSKPGSLESHPAIKPRHRNSPDERVRAEAFTSGNSLKRVTLDSGSRKSHDPLPESPSNEDSASSLEQAKPLTKVNEAPSRHLPPAEPEIIITGRSGKGRGLLLIVAIASLLCLLAFPRFSAWFSTAEKMATGEE